MLLPPAGWNTGVSLHAGRASRMETDVMTLQVSRRQALALAAGGLAAATGGLPTTALAKNDADEIIKSFTGGKEPVKGKVKLDLPEIAENGNTVPMTVSVESPMTADDHVKAIHVFNEKNPQPSVFTAQLSPRNGKAIVGTRIKLGDSQKVVAIAEMSDGKFYSASADVIVTLAACLEEAT